MGIVHGRMFIFLDVGFLLEVVGVGGGVLGTEVVEILDP